MPVVPHKAVADVLKIGNAYTGKVGCCESRMAEQKHWWTDRRLRSPLFLFPWLSTWSRGHRWPHMFLHLVHFVPRFTMFRGFFGLQSYLRRLFWCHLDSSKTTLTGGVESLVSLWTRTLSQVWTCVMYVPKRSIVYSTLNTKVFTGWTCVKYVPTQHKSIFVCILDHFGIFAQCSTKMICINAKKCKSLCVFWYIDS